MSGIAGRTNYSDWDKKTNVLLSDLEKEQEQEIMANKEALGHGKYANSEAEAEERNKAKQVKKVKKQLDSYKNREESIVQEISNVFDNDDGDDDDDDHKNPLTIVRITRDRMEARKRVLRVTDVSGPGTIVLTQDLTHLKSIVPSNSKLVPKSYPQDAENNVSNQTSSSSSSNNNKDENVQNMESHHGSVQGLIKVSLTHLRNCTIIIKCKVITGLLEISHCENIVVKMEKTCTVVTVQADICENVKLEFHDVPSGKANSRSMVNSASDDDDVRTNMFWGEDKDDRVFHAGVKGLCIQTFRDGFLDLETVQDYLKNGAKQVGNVTAEEVQFVTSVIDGELVTERVLRQGAQTGTTVAGAVGGGSAGSAGRAMTEREMKKVREKKKQIQEAMESGSLLSGIKIVNPQGEDVPPIQNGQKQDSMVVEKKNEEDTENIENKVPQTTHKENVEHDDIVEEVYAGMSSSDIDAIVQDCETQKARGNEAFAAGEYAQAVLLYTLTLDRASELPDATMDPKLCKKWLFPRHVVLSNRSASFLKLGHHEKALKDATEAEKLDPTYVKAVFRKGLALHAMGRYQEAIIPLAAALKMEPKNKQIKQALQFAEVRMHQELKKRMES